MLAILIGLIIGIGLPIQTSINSRLKFSVGSPLVASLISFSLGTLFLALITIFFDKSLFFSLNLFRKEPVWLWLGGLLGVIYLTSNILLFPKLGSVQTVIMPILGQIIMGLVIDNFGLFDSLVHPLNWSRIIGAILVIIGVVGAVSINQIILYRHKKFLPDRTNNFWYYRLIGIVVGMFSATQTAINGHLGIVLNSSVKAAFISFFVGTISLIVIVAIIHPRLSFQKSKENPWWLWLGGLIGALFVLGNVYLVPKIGTGLAVVIVLVGLIIGSLLIDQFGWFRSAKNPITFAQIVSLLIMIFGVVIIRLL
ncbi:DMT family transporter [Companilactobacillus futsaii]|uniref:DMT family transporter n=2 Tax=Companilactobacillus futsaii TaxID=938155 RepID=A0A5B7SZY6_9LACO|nr:DMT family transporter [Companilactobacillus futsaii]KRK92605.1 integral membrane protein [Companilactobacillus futsaii JCM 17355]QCX25357.1 DMT family transporter [Companilactobacillus futsaii]